MSDTNKATAAEKAAPSVDLADTLGNPIGVTVRLKGAKETVDAEEGETKEHLRLRTIAKNIAGVSTMEVDGEPWTFSQERALALLQSHPHFADQIEAGIKKG
ncbi:hypothetical protein GCM10011390_41660 [Aureimonas endophytica]|uniref:Uncharacterized protein n=1 Tax=Aureimonas endophytica TaxID=2027858 RepID=A0A916ZXP6_9HYPH|nr:hypothetical protein [Aureimonas endophytica]GGE18141.1 hypothetical protein GCM10011390_41660 [Aureimonas endophytica]